jgi:hypothetical protein
MGGPRGAGTGRRGRRVTPYRALAITHTRRRINARCLVQDTVRVPLRRRLAATYTTKPPSALFVSVAAVCGLREAWRQPQHRRLGSPCAFGIAAVILGIADREGIWPSHNMEQWVGIGSAGSIHRRRSRLPGPGPAFPPTFRSLGRQISHPHHWRDILPGSIPPNWSTCVLVRVTARVCAIWRDHMASRTRPSVECFDGRGHNPRLCSCRNRLAPRARA